MEATSLGRVVIGGLCSYPLPSSRWFPPKVSEGSFRKPLGERPLSLGNGEREHQRVGPGSLLEKLEAERLKGE